MALLNLPDQTTVEAKDVLSIHLFTVNRLLIYRLKTGVELKFRIPLDVKMDKYHDKVVREWSARLAA